MDNADLSRVNILYAQREPLLAGLDNLVDGGPIVQMLIASIHPAKPPATIPTGDWQYPPTMVEAIKTELQNRITEINNQLRSLGVTGL